MSESIAIRTNNVSDALSAGELYRLLLAVQLDLAALRTSLNAHTHGGITAGAATSGVANASTMGALETLV